MEVIGYRSPFYSPEKDYEEAEAGIEKLMKAFCGELDDEEIAELRAQGIQRMFLRKEKAKREAQKILKAAGRPIRRKDMLEAMDLGIIERVGCFEKEADMRNAALLLGMIVCRNLLTDGPLHES